MGVLRNRDARSTDEQVREYVAANYMRGISLDNADLDTLFGLYPADPAVGSPFDTGNANAIGPQYKRLAAIQGDLVFQAPRRFFLEHRSGRQPTWSYCMPLLLPAMST